MQDYQQQETKQFGFGAIIGPPNSGKSTLVNLLVGSKIAAVTHKAQTTRFRTLGVFQHQNAQIALADTPGIFKPNRKLDRAMLKSAWSAFNRSDVVLVLLDAHKAITPILTAIEKNLADLCKTIMVAINKIDTLSSKELLPIAKMLDQRKIFNEILMISALNGSGCDKLKDCFATYMPQGQWMYPPEQIRDINDQLFSCELTREQLL
ncbi:MAG: GTPase Era, partial [Pseudomonadota bacterium]